MFRKMQERGSAQKGHIIASAIRPGASTVHAQVWSGRYPFGQLAHQMTRLPMSKAKTICTSLP